MNRNLLKCYLAIVLLIDFRYLRAPLGAFGRALKLNRKIGCPKASISNKAGSLDIIEFFIKTEARIYDVCAPLYKKGLSISDIADQTGYKRTSIWRTLKKKKSDLREQDPVPFVRWRKGSGKMRARPPYGYCYFQGEVIQDPREYPVLQLINAMKKNGESISSIQRKLNGRKTFSRSGKPWTYNVIKSIVYRLSKGALDSFGSTTKSQKSKQSKKRGQNELR